MQEFIHQFEQRKKDHIELALLPQNQSSELNALDQIVLDHEALPDLNFDEIDIQSQRLGQTTATPFIVSSMTAGHQQAQSINENLMAACAQQGWGMGVGSQRRELTDPKAAEEWQQLRKKFPNVQLMGNLGAAQLITANLDAIRRLTDNLQTNWLIIHANPLQECIQPEGTPQFKGFYQALEQLIQRSDLKIIIKETGCGFSTRTLQRLKNSGIAAVDLSGLGGTHWGRIEGHRADHAPSHQQAARSFANWGISTTQSLLNALAVQPDYEIWGSGGIRHGLDAARLIALGAQTIGLAKPMLAAALTGSESVIQQMQAIEYELKVALFCTGSRTLADLRGKAHVQA